MQRAPGGKRGPNEPGNEIPGILRRLAIVDEGFVGDQAGLVLDPPATCALDPKTAALVRAGALAAIGAPEACLEWSSSQALALGATEDEITGVLLVIASVIGLDRIVGAAPGVAGAFGYDIEAALEDPDDPSRLPGGAGSVRERTGPAPGTPGWTARPIRNRGGRREVFRLSG